MKLNYKLDYLTLIVIPSNEYSYEKYRKILKDIFQNDFKNMPVNKPRIIFELQNLLDGELICKWGGHKYEDGNGLEIVHRTIKGVNRFQITFKGEFFLKNSSIKLIQDLIIHFKKEKLNFYLTRIDVAVDVNIRALKIIRAVEKGTYVNLRNHSEELEQALYRYGSKKNFHSLTIFNSTISLQVYDKINQLNKSKNKTQKEYKRKYFLINHEKENWSDNTRVEIKLKQRSDFYTSCLKEILNNPSELILLAKDKNRNVATFLKHIEKLLRG